MSTPYLPIHGNKTAAIVVDPLPVAANQVGVHVDSTHKGSGGEDEVAAKVELAQLVMASTAVGEDLHAIHAHADVRTDKRKYEQEMNFNVQYLCIYRQKLRLTELCFVLELVIHMRYHGFSWNCFS